MQATLTYRAAPPAMKSRMLGVLSVCIGLGPIGFLPSASSPRRIGAAHATALCAATGVLVLALTRPIWRAIVDPGMVRPNEHIQSLDRALAALPARYLGPRRRRTPYAQGRRNSSHRHTWGWSDLERRIPFTPETMFLVCSITKQFTLRPDARPAPRPHRPRRRHRRPHAPARPPPPSPTDLPATSSAACADHLAADRACSCGAPVEGVFTEGDASRLIARTASLHFTPGTRYSYCRPELPPHRRRHRRRAGRPYADLLRQRILARRHGKPPASPPTPPDVPGGTVGYEGTPESGFRPAVNNIIWTGDAGLAASLDDMIAWERHIDAHRDDPAPLYQRQSAPVHFTDGALAGYGYGLARMKLFGHDATGHGGGLRGWRSFRFCIPAERISVVAMFNHMTDPRPPRSTSSPPSSTKHLPPPPRPPPGPAATSNPNLGLATRIEPAGEGRLRLHFGPGPDTLAATTAGPYTAGQSPSNPPATPSA
jgi:D-aminopeptidase